MKIRYEIFVMSDTTLLNNNKILCYVYNVECAVESRRPSEMIWKISGETVKAAQMRDDASFENEVFSRDVGN